MTNLTGSNLNNGLAIDPKGEGRDSPSKYPAYPEYKDSGVEWLGKIPKHWKISKVKYVTRCLDGTRVPLNGEQRSNIKGDYPYWGANGIVDYVNQWIFDDYLILLGEDGAPFFDPFKDVAFNVEGKIWVNNHAHILKTSPKVVREFLTYALNQIDYYLYINGSTRDKLTQRDMGAISFRLPPLREQTQIATYLDRETQKIDRLIEKQQQLIKLLQEKRQAVISHAVTKGLNPNVKMKDSRVEWLGKIPENWEIKALRFLGLCQNGINIGAEQFGSGYPFVSYGDIYHNRVLPSTGSDLVQSSESDRKRYSVKSGDVFFTRTSETIDEIGYSSTCLSDIENATFAGFLIRFRPTTNILKTGFSKYYFSNLLLRAYFVKEMNLVTRASLSQDLLKKLPVVIPPKDEQMKISDYLDSKLSKIDMLLKKSKRAIELSKERRTALITAAVTGKIDVRNIVVNNTSSHTIEQEAVAL